MSKGTVGSIEISKIIIRQMSLAELLMAFLAMITPVFCHKCYLMELHFGHFGQPSFQ
jgi:hypothetical protein